jgi:hypothetical protein
MRNILGISARWVSGTLARAVTLAFVIGGPAQAAAPPQPKSLTIVDRVERIRTTIGDREQPLLVARAPGESESSAANQWPNWNNWRNWRNWNNWRNWGNWRNI